MELLNNVTSAGRGSFKVESLAKRVEEILASPFGCAFFANAGEFGYLPEDLVNPAVSMPLAAEAVGYVEKWNADHEADVERALGLAPVIRPLVESTLAHDGTAWWYEPLAPERQVWVAHEGETPEPSDWKRPNSPPSRWERYAQKPLGLQYTTTLHQGYASLLIAYENRAGDLWPQSWPLQCWGMRMPADVKVYELNGPQDWHRLCVAYSAHDFDDGRLVPDWGAASADWDGVHLSLGGLLSCEQRRVDSAEGWSMHEFWHAETTFWLRALDATCERMPDYHGGEERPAPSGERQQIWPPYRPSEDTPGVFYLRRYESDGTSSDIEALMEAERRRIAGVADGDEGEPSSE